MGTILNDKPQTVVFSNHQNMMCQVLMWNVKCLDVHLPSYHPQDVHTSIQHFKNGCQACLATHFLPNSQIGTI